MFEFHTLQMSPRKTTQSGEVRIVDSRNGHKAIGIAGDITQEEFCQQLVEEAVQGLGGLDILVNNAGKQATRPFVSDITSDQFDQTLKTNLYALFWITKAARDHLKPGAAIINTASVQVFEPSQALLDYATTKARIVAFTKALSKQMIERGVRVNRGGTWSLLDRATAERRPNPGKGPTFWRKCADGEARSAHRNRAHLVLLASQEASFVTGDVYGVTGGEGII